MPTALDLLLELYTVPVIDDELTCMCTLPPPSSLDPPTTKFDSSDNSESKAGLWPLTTP